MFRDLKRKFEEFANKSILNKSSKIIINDHQENKAENILSCEINDNLIKLEILSECTFKEYGAAIDKYEKEINGIRIPIRMFITNGENLINAKLQKQKIFIVSRDNVTYCIVSTSSKVKLSEKIYQNDEINEITLDIDKNSNEYSIVKYIHDLNYSTKFCKWYPIHDDSLNDFALNRFQAIESFKIFLLKLEKIKDIEIFPDMKNLYDLVNLIGNSILSGDMKETFINLKEDSNFFPEIVNNQVDSINSYQKTINQNR